MNNPRLQSRRAFTLVEMSLSLIGTSVLVGGMMSALFVTMKSLDPNLSNATTIMATTEVLNQMRELQFATEFRDNWSREVDVYLPDQNADSYEERVEYSWSGFPGAPLIRKYNFQSRTIAPTVYHFSLSYITSGSHNIGMIVELQLTTNSSDRVQVEIPVLNKPRTYQYGGGD